MISLVWRYATTIAQVDGLSFGTNSGVIFIDPAGLNQVPFWVTEPEATIDFTLYTLSPAGAIERYLQQQSGTPVPLEVAGLPVAASWQQHFASGDPNAMRPTPLPTAAVPSGLYVLEAAT
ncbi:MAG TPA: hypothetical protein PKE45_26240, partial [Caldilineaceae bacterium]|nr:hypothetical protein [Caldilineaceae bacterium]